MGKADYLSLGDWNAVCYQCGRKRKASQMKKYWEGYYVCPEHWEPRQAQDFVRGVPDNMSTPWAQPFPTDLFIVVCSVLDRTAIPSYAMPGCSIPGTLTQPWMLII